MSISPLRLLVFLTIVLGITGGLHYYVWARLVRDPALPAPWFSLATAAIVLLALLQPAAMLLTRAAPRPVTSPVAWVAYLWLGLLFFLFVLLVGADAVRAVAAVARKLQGAPLDPARRQALARLVGSAVALTGTGLAGAAAYFALRPVAVKQVRVPLAKLHADLHGYTIAQISDIHVGPTIGKNFIEQLVTKINAMEPDLVAITGDLVDGSVAELGALVASLANLRARDGVYFVTGNHEYFSGVDEWVEFLRTLGIRVLRNERVPVRGATGFDLAGIEDWSSRRIAGGRGPDLAGALAGRDPARPVVLLAHQPKGVEHAAELGVDLQLSGHTHGGQLFPFNYLVALEQPYVAGLHARGATQIYVSRGTGYWGPPMRLLAPAEITRIELVPA